MTEKLTIEKAREIYARGPAFDLGPDAEYYRSHGFILAWEARQVEVDKLNEAVRRLSGRVAEALNNVPF